jgi:hypothetical protein
MAAHLGVCWIRERRVFAQEAPASRGRASSGRALIKQPATGRSTPVIDAQLPLSPPLRAVALNEVAKESVLTSPTAPPHRVAMTRLAAPAVAREHRVTAWDSASRRIAQLVEVEEGISARLVRRRFTMTSPKEMVGRTRVISRMATFGSAIAFAPLP